MASACCFAVLAQTASAPESKQVAKGPDPEVKAGGVVLTLPGPASDFAEVGDRLRTTVFELMAPSSNRLLTAYLPARYLGDSNGGTSAGPFDVSALVEVPRQAEYRACKPKDFEELLKGLESTMGKFDAEHVEQVENELNTRLKSLGTKPIEMGHPEMLGGIFRKTDASGYAMLMALKQEDRSITMACGFGVLRVRERVLFAYLYHKYESPDTVRSLRKETETWADLILAKNK
jgi:hypothetical protein